MQKNIIKVKDFGPDILRYDPKKKDFIAQVVSTEPEQSKPISYSNTWKLVPPQPGHNLVDCK
jgi:hypothetical protein